MSVALTSVNVQMQLAGTGGPWTTVTDVRFPPAVELAYGIPGNGPHDRVATTGTLTFALDNSEKNSGGLLGYYSPGHANCRSGFELGIRVRLTLVYGGVTYYKFVGTLDEIAPTPDRFGERLTYCTAVDWMDEAATQKINSVATQVGKRADELFATLVANVTRAPVSTLTYLAQIEFPFGLDTANDESTRIISELAKIADSELGYVFIKGDTSAGGVLVYADRRTRQGAASPATTLDNTGAIKARRGRKEIYNRVKVVVHPRVVDAEATTVLYRLDQSSPPSIAPGESITIFGQYTDPALRANRVGGTDMVTPVSGTDYAFGTGPGDTSLTADLGVSVSYGGNGAIYTLTNNGTKSGFVTLLQARGRGLYDYNAITLEAQDATSKAAYGEQVLTFDLPYEARANMGQAIATYMLARYKDPFYSEESRVFEASATDALMTAALAREPNDLIAITETMLGLASAAYYIQSCKLTIESTAVMVCEWGVTPRLDATAYWVLGTSLLGTTTVLGW